MAGPAHIQFAEMIHYCDFYSIKGFQKRIDFADYIRLLDNIWLDDFYEKEKKRRAEEDRKNNNNKNKKR